MAISNNQITNRRSSRHEPPEQRSPMVVSNPRKKDSTADGGGGEHTHFAGLRTVLLMVLVVFLLVLHGAIPSYSHLDDLGSASGGDASSSSSLSSSGSARADEKTPSAKKDNDESVVYDVVIGGAGAAGMGAVHTLESLARAKNTSLNWILLEGKEGLGGKIKTTEFGGHAIETAAGYVSGGEDNPFYCTMEQMFGTEGGSGSNSFGGLNIRSKYRVHDDAGNQLDAVSRFSYHDWEKPPAHAGQRMSRAYQMAAWYGSQCLVPENYRMLDEEDRVGCNDLCSINLTEIRSDKPSQDDARAAAFGHTHESIFDLVETDQNLCHHTGIFPGPSPGMDASVTDLLRVDAEFGRYFAPTDPDGACVARVVESVNLDKEIGNTPWRTSGKSGFDHGPIFGDDPDFGNNLDYLVADPRGYVYLLKRKLAEVLTTKENSPERIVFDEPDRLKFHSKITRVQWDPDGRSNVEIEYCRTVKRGFNDYPCADEDRKVIHAKHFIATFPRGVLKKSLDVERNQPTAHTADVAPVFEPGLGTHQELAATLDASHMGALTKVYVRFRCRFWDDAIETFFLPYNASGYTCDYAPLVYSLDAKNALPGSRILAVALTGRRGIEVAELADEMNKHQGGNHTNWASEQFLPVFNHHFKEDIQKMCGKPKLTPEDVLDVFVPTWYTDPQSRGCWLTQPLQLQQEHGSNDTPFKWGRLGNLLLSGEATCGRQSGWVTGGWFSGERSAKRLLQERYAETFSDLDTRTLCEADKRQMKFNNRTCAWAPIPNQHRTSDGGGVPVLSNWLQLDDGSLEGVVVGSTIADDGEWLVTSAVLQGQNVAPGKIVATESGARYFLTLTRKEQARTKARKATKQRARPLRSEPFRDNEDHSAAAAADATAAMARRKKLRR